MLAELREQVRLTALAMATTGLVTGTDGNVSAKDPATGLVVITPSGIPYAEIATDDVMIVDVDRNVVWGRNEPSWETPMHTYIHKHRADVFAVMHTHSWFASLFAYANRDLQPVTMSLSAQFGRTVRCAPYTRTGSADVCGVILDHLGSDGKAVLLGNHGTLCAGPSLEKVLKWSEALERGAKLAYHASTLGPLVPLPPPEVQWMYDLAAGFAAAEQQPDAATTSHT
jgi:L-ribulose-5-phosphate 4-epimerase